MAKKPSKSARTAHSKSSKPKAGKPKARRGGLHGPGEDSTDIITGWRPKDPNAPESAEGDEEENG